MRKFQVCTLTLLLITMSGIALADSINDPKVIVHGVAGGQIPCGSHNCEGVGANFSFDIPKSGSGILYFTNESGHNWTSLTFVETGVPAADVECSQTFFLTCKSETLKNGSVEIILSGVKGNNPRTGIANGQSFLVQFACVQKDCWPGGLQVHAHAGGVGITPEPGTMALMLTGAGVLISRRKQWRNRFNS